MKYLACILMGCRSGTASDCLITLTPELAQEHGISGIKLSTCFILFQVGIAAGDLSSGILRWLRTRKRVLLGYMGFGVLATVLHYLRIYQSAGIETTSFLMGLGCGYHRSSSPAPRNNSAPTSA